jgi:hypothetical protein
LIKTCRGQETIFIVIELQAKWVARVLSGKILLPTEEEMMESVKDIYRIMEENALPKHYTHSIRPFQVCAFVFPPHYTFHLIIFLN